MKILIYTWIFIVGISLGFSSNAQAYQCYWHHGQKVCWHHSHCRWVHGHWHNGYYYRSHKVCW